MAKDDSLKKPKKIDVNRIMIFISSILIPFLWIDLYLVLKNTSKLMVVGIIATLILVWTGLLVAYIHRMKNEEKAHSDEQVEELLRTGKANYLMQKKLAEKIDNIGEKVAIPADEIITAQKAIAKLTLARNKENTDALMHSNEQVIEKTLEVEERLSENNQQIIDMQKNLMDEKLQELTQSQKLVLDNLNAVKESLQSDMQDVLSNMIHEALEKELASAIEQIHTYVKETASQAVDSVKENLAAEVPVMAAVSPTEDEELPDLGIPTEDEELPDLGMPTEDEEMPDLGMPAESEELPDPGMPAEDEELPDLGMPAESEEMPDLGMPTEDEEMPDLGMPTESEEMPDLGMPAESEELPDSGMPTESEELPDLGMPAESEEMPDLGILTEDEELPDLGIPTEDEELPDLGMPTESEELPDLGMPAMDEDLSNMELPVLGEELSETELPDLSDCSDLSEEPVIGEMPLMEEEPVEEVMPEEIPAMEETAEPETDMLTLTEEIPISPEESVIEEVKIPEETTMTEEIPVSADESVIEEVPAQEAEPSMADISNPNKIMTPDEIAALIANL